MAQRTTSNGRHRNMRGKGLLDMEGLRHQSINAVGSLVAPWYQPITDIIGANGFLVSHEEGITEAVGQPVSAWRDVRGTTIFTQPGVSSLRPIRFANGLVFDGVDDRFIADAYADLLEGAHTIIIGFDDPDDVGTAARTVFAAANAASSGTRRQVSTNFSLPSIPNATRERHYLADGATAVSISLIAASAGAGPYNLVFRNAGLGGDARADTLTAPLVQLGATVTRPAGVELYTLLTLGARRIGAGPTLTQVWQGRIRYVLCANFQLSDVELETVRATLSAKGLL